MAEDAQTKLSEILALHQSGAVQQAQQSIEQLVKQYPESSDVLNIAACFQLEKQDYYHARDYLERCVAIRPHPIYLNNLGIAYKQTAAVQQAEHCFVQALEMSADHVDARINLAILLYEQKRQQESYEQFAKLPYCYDNPLYCRYYGMLKLYNNQYREARELFLHGKRLKPNDPMMQYWLTLTYRHSGDIDKVKHMAEDALTRYSMSREMKHHYKSLLAYNYLLLGDFAKGWPLYQHRDSYRVISQVMQSYPQLPYWEPKNRSQQKLLVIVEEGIGDQLMYMTHLSFLQQRVEKIYLQCDVRFKNLFQRTFPDVMTIDRYDDIVLTEIVAQSDAYLSMNDLPRLLNPQMRPFDFLLLVDTAKVQHWRQLLRERFGNRRLVGISYHTAARNGNIRMPSKAFWQSLFSRCDETVFINLQENHQTVEEKRQYLYDEKKLQQVGDVDLYNDFDQLSALITAVDEVVSIDNSVAHFSGSLKRPTRLLLPRVCSWRWQLNGNKTLWYPTVELMRSQDDRDWSVLCEQLINCYG
ncbi:MAG: hypothetical protein GY782_04645 [Gammaproteobacteria bacterium]|nr:hypothetical protein [Gammaproteobacteria bacterium]